MLQAFVGGREYLTKAEVGRLLALSLSSVDRMLRDGRLTPRRLRGSRRVLILKCEAEGLIESAPLPVDSHLEGGT